MQRRKFSREFKLEAVKLVRERGVSVCVWHGLLAKGLLCGLHRIEPLMRVHGLKAGTPDALLHHSDQGSQ